MRDKVTAAFDSLRSSGEKTIQVAREGPYSSVSAERVPDIYYGILLQAVPFLLAATNGYHKLTYAQQLSPDDLELFRKKANTAEEKLIRVMTALKYGVEDMDLSRLREQQARVGAALAAGNTDAANSIVKEVIDLEFFYPPVFRPVLLGKGMANPVTARPTN